MKQPQVAAGVVKETVLDGARGRVLHQRVATRRILFRFASRHGGYEGLFELNACFDYIFGQAAICALRRRSTSGPARPVLEFPRTVLSGRRCSRRLPPAPRDPSHALDVGHQFVVACRKRIAHLQPDSLPHRPFLDMAEAEDRRSGQSAAARSASRARSPGKARLACDRPAYFFFPVNVPSPRSPTATFPFMVDDVRRAGVGDG